MWVPRINLPSIVLLISWQFQLVLFLSACKGDIDNAAKHMERYYSLKITSPELFWNRDPESEDLQFSFKIQQMAPLPITPDDCYLFIHRVSDADPKMYNFDDVFKMFIMMAGKRQLTYLKLVFRELVIYYRKHCYVTWTEKINFHIRLERNTIWTSS